MNELSNDVIIRAAAGEPDAIEKVLKRYDAYINSYATEQINTDSGRIHFEVNEDWKSYIVLQVIEAILRWRVLPDDDPAGRSV